MVKTKRENSILHTVNEWAVIVYYTGTGNSLQVARALNDKLGGSLLPAARLVSDTECVMEHDGLLGIVCPVHFYGLPMTIVNFLSNMSFPGEPPKIFLVLTCGTFTGDADKEATRLLESRGLAIDFVFSIKMPENYTPLFRVPPQDEIDRMLDSVDAETDFIVDTIVNGSKGNYNKNSGGLLGKFMTKLARGYFVRGRKTSGFKLNDKCTGCGTCVKICPVHAMEVQDGKAVWVSKRCDLCLACLHRCPHWAIERGSLSKRGRYVNPCLKDMP